VRIILAGSRSFGAATYEMLVEEGHDVAAVWSPAKDALGHPDALLKVARSDWVPLPERTPTVVRMLEVDIFVAAHSHDFISRAARQATRLGGVGFHPSLLPRHRGRDAVRWTIHMGDPITGGSVYWLTDNVDGGPIAAQDWCFVRPDDDHSTLWRRELFVMGIRLLRDTLRALDGGVIVEVPQDESVATWEPSWERPPLHRPDLPQLGARAGFKHAVTREALSIRFA
jgi:methionyl-tRNA formyltransferase